MQRRMAERPPPVPSAASLARLRAGFQRAVDEERRKLARTLHDSALQTLTAATMNLSLIERESAALSPQGRQAVSDALAQIEACGRELRDLSHALFPSLLGSAGLGPALRWLARQRGEQRLVLELADLPRFSVSIELTAYRLIEESLGGLFEESGPVRVHVDAPAEDVLEVTLEGPARRSENGQVADLTLRQRIRAVGARLRTRVVTAGLRVEVRFPPSVPDIEG
jgi:signal transduction histidine kinase